MTDRITDTIKPTCICGSFFQNNHQQERDVNGQRKDAVYYAHRLFKRLNTEGKGLLPLELLKYQHSTPCINMTRYKARAAPVGLQKTAIPRFYMILEDACPLFFLMLLKTNYTQILNPFIYYDYIKNTHHHRPTFYYLLRHLRDCLQLTRMTSNETVVDTYTQLLKKKKKVK